MSAAQGVLELLGLSKFSDQVAGTQDKAFCGDIPHLLILYVRTARLRGRLVVIENEDPEQAFLVSSRSEISCFLMLEA